MGCVSNPVVELAFGNSASYAPISNKFSHFNLFCIADEGEKQIRRRVTVDDRSQAVFRTEQSSASALRPPASVH